MSFLQEAKKVLHNAQNSLNHLEKIVESGIFTSVIDMLFYTKGRIILSGIGKSGYIAQKIAASMSSLGKSAIFIHPSEASHGDLGLISENDCLIALSKSGTSIELEDIIRYMQHNRMPIISITMNKDSFLARESNIAIILDDLADGCVGTNAPMSSTITMLALGDCIAAAIASRIGFNKDKYSLIHPGGKLGKSMTKVKYIMRTDDRIPVVSEDTNLHDIIIEMTQKMLGITGVGDKNKLIGVITDGDLRRTLAKGVDNVTAKDIMTQNFKYLTHDMFVDNAIQTLTDNKITSSFVMDENMKLVGAINIHDLLK